jgi:hypothetical protein
MATLPPENGYLGDVMNLEQIPFRVVVRWVLFGVAFLFVTVPLGIDGMAGLIPVALGFVHLWVFRPVVTPHVTDAELEAWLNLG